MAVSLHFGSQWLSSSILSNQVSIIARPDHIVSRADIHENALKVLYRLHNAGFRSLLVGGCVRDLLLNRHPKDFDVATDAHPEQIKSLFDNCRLIGRRFRLAHILFGRDVVEVATFRGKDAEPEDDSRLNAKNGRLLRDNVYGCIDEDVWRRDFTVNALYYNIADFSLIDYTAGIQDIRDRIIRLIGDPQQRYREDPVRMLRALRFAAKLQFTIEPKTAEPIYKMGKLLCDIPPARLFDELLKLFHGGAARASFALLEQYGLMKHLFPATDKCLQQQAVPYAQDFLSRVLDNTDQRIAEGKSVTPAFLFSAFLWIPIIANFNGKTAQRMNVLEIQKAGSRVLAPQQKATAIPRRVTSMMREIWTLQPRLQRYTGRRALQLLSHPRFRAAFDFLVLRAQAGGELQERAQWWTEIQSKAPEEQAQMARQLEGKSHRRGRRSSGKRINRAQ